MATLSEKYSVEMNDAIKKARQKQIEEDNAKDAWYKILGKQALRAVAPYTVESYEKTGKVGQFAPITDFAGNSMMAVGKPMQMLGGAIQGVANDVSQQYQNDGDFDPTRSAMMAGLSVLPSGHDAQGAVRSSADDLAKAYKDVKSRIISPEERAKNLAKFMEGSKVTEPVYHGTNKLFSEFDPSLSGSKSNTGAPKGSYFFSSDPEYASSYTVERNSDFSPNTYFEGANVLKTHVSLKKPLVVNAKGNNWRDIVYKGDFYDINELVELAKSSGKYDGVIVKNVNDKGIGDVKNKTANTVIAFSPNQIKSATGNRGTFDANDPNILHSLAPIGALGGLGAMYGLEESKSQ